MEIYFIYKKGFRMLGGASRSRVVKLDMKPFYREASRLVKYVDSL